MNKWIEMPWGQVSSYEFWINAGSVVGSIGLLLSLYFLLKSKKEAVLIYLSMLAVMALGAYPARIVRGLTHGGIESITDVLNLTTYPGSHFIGRVLFCIIVYPFCFRLLFRKRKEWCGAVMDRYCLFFTFQHVFNRIACFFNGCCVGKYYNGFLAMKYPEVEGAAGGGYSYPVYPVQLFEAAGMVLLFLVLFFFYKKGKRITGGFEIGFGIVIFLAEFMMDVSGTVQIAGLTVVQYAAVLLMGIGICECAAEIRHDRKK